MRRHAKAPPLAGTTSSTGTRTAGAFGRFSLAILGALCLALALAATATATPTQKTCAQVGGSNAHCFNGADTPAGNMEPTWTGVDEASGDVYVIDSANDVVDRFSKSGAYLGQLTGASTPAGSFGFAGSHDDIAVDNSGGATQGNVYVVGNYGPFLEGRLTAFDAEGNELWQVTSPPFEFEVNIDKICGVGVEPNGNLWVGESDKGAQQRSVADGSRIGSTYQIFAYPCDLAFDSTGIAYNASFGEVVYQFSPSIKGSETPFEGAYKDVATDTTTNLAYVDEGSSFSVFNSSLEFQTSFGSASTYNGITVNGSLERIYATTQGEGVQIWSLAEEEPSGPTNRAALTLTKSAGGTGGTGSVSSKPKGINCASACNEAVAKMYKNTPVTLKEKPSTGSVFVEWTGACSGSGEACTVPMAEAESVGAVFSGTSKAIANPQALTLSKGESSGYGTVKAAGLACEAECSTETVLYQGPTGVAPKNKPGKAVELKATPAFGSSFTGFSGGGCSGSEPVCIVTMEEAQEVTATFTAKPTTTLTIAKGGTGTGTISSKPKAINCGTICTSQDATVPTEAEVILKEKPGTGMTFTGWSGGGCSGTAETCTVSLTEAATVTASFSGSPKAIANAQKLTLTKAGSGYGTVKAAGLTCEVLCTSTVALYQGPTGVAPKNKPGKTVVLKATSAPGSKQVEWSGCLSEPTPTECSVTMEEAVGVTATFNEIE